MIPKRSAQLFSNAENRTPQRGYHCIPQAALLGSAPPTTLWSKPGPDGQEVEETR